MKAKNTIRKKFLDEYLNKLTATHANKFSK